MKEKKELVKDVGLFCGYFRENILKISLTEFASVTGYNLKNIHAFEKGRANNIMYLSLYYNMCDEIQGEIFSKELFEVL